MHPSRPRVSAPSCLPSWLLTRKVVAPELPRGHVPRAALLRHLDGFLERRLTVLHAPAGFGKTAALAEIARNTRAQGLLAGWLTFDGADAPDAFGSYVALALERAGLDLGLPAAPEAWWSLPAVHQVGLVARAVELHESPCLLALDEVERLPLPTFQLIDLLLEHAPRNLHVVLAWRSDPGLDLATHVLAGEAVIAGPEELRFSQSEMAQCLGGELSRRELAAVEEDTGGWPFALAAWRDARGGAGARPAAEAAVLTENYFRVRLLRGLSVEDRNALLDLAVFDLIEAELVDDVLGSSRARVRISGLSALDGLLPSVDAERSVRRLHPLLRRHCLHLLATEDPCRKRSLQERLARALVRRGDLEAAWRHAAATGDKRLVADLIEPCGVSRLWLRAGAPLLLAAGRYLTAGAAASHPRLELLRCSALRLSGKPHAAQALLAATARATNGFTRDRDGGDDDALAADGRLARMLLAGAAAPGDGGLEPAPAAGGSAAAGADGLDSAAARHAWLCIAHHERADFCASLRHGEWARRACAGDLRHGAVVVDMYQGMSAMAQGRVTEAAASYARARRDIRKHFSNDSWPAMAVDVLATELDVERGRAQACPMPALQRLAELPEVWADIHAAALTVSAELAFERGGGDEVVEHLTAAADGVWAKGAASLTHTLGALLAHYLAEAGRPDAAGRAWRDHGLPCAAAELLDLRGQSWRTMEALACARARLLAARGEDEAAEELARRLCGAAAERGLTRTRLRGLALSMAVADGAGQPDRAAARLVEFLRLAGETDYAGPLLRRREAGRRLLQRLLGRRPDEDVRRAAEALLPRMVRAPVDHDGTFTHTELRVLQEVQLGLRNGEIGSRLGMTVDGVRYHLKRIYRKTGASRRADAVRHARSLGALP